MDKVLEEEVRKELLMSNWENNISSSHPILKETTVEERIKEEVERRLNQLNGTADIKDFNLFMMKLHERERERQAQRSKQELENRKRLEEELRRFEEQRREDMKHNQKLYGQTLD